MSVAIPVVALLTVSAPLAPAPAIAVKAPKRNVPLFINSWPAFCSPCFINALPLLTSLIPLVIELADILVDSAINEKNLPKNGVLLKSCKSSGTKS